MKRNLAAAILLLGFVCASAQGRPAERPSVYDQVDQVRKELKLDQKQFDKLYSAYEKYDKEVFGSSNAAPTPGGRPGGGPGGHGGPGGGMGPGGGPGGPGGGMGPGGGGMGPGGPGGMRPEGGEGPGRPSQDGAKPADLEKFEKTKAKQEEKLEKTVKKLFKKNEPLFLKWKEIRADQLQRLFPAPPPRPE